MNDENLLAVADRRLDGEDRQGVGHDGRAKASSSASRDRFTIAIAAAAK